MRQWEIYSQLCLRLNQCSSEPLRQQRKNQRNIVNTVTTLSMSLISAGYWSISTSIMKSMYSSTRSMEEILTTDLTKTTSFMLNHFWKNGASTARIWLIYGKKLIIIMVMGAVLFCLLISLIGQSINIFTTIRILMMISVILMTMDDQYKR